MGGAKIRKAEWLAAVRWRQRVESVLASSELTFTQWLVLDATRNLIGATEDAVSQGDVAAHLEMHRATVSDAMVALDRKGLADRGGAAEGPAWRIFLTRKASELLRQIDPLIEGVSEWQRVKPAEQQPNRRVGP